MIQSAWALSLLSVFLLYLSLNNYLFGLLIFIAFIPLFCLAEKKKIRFPALWFGFAGFVLYLLTLYWMMYATFAGFLCMCFVLSLYFAGFAWIYEKAHFKNVFLRTLFAACLWTFLEYFRGSGSFAFPWFFAGYALHMNPWLIQNVSWGGFYFLSFLVIWVNHGLYEIFFTAERRAFKKKIFLLFGYLFPLGLALSYGRFRLQESAFLMKPDSSLKIAVVQANIPQEEKWANGFLREIVNQYKKLTKEAIQGKPDLVLWPETSLPGDLRKDKRLRKEVFDLARLSGTWMIVGANDDRLDSEGVVTNTAFYISPKGKIEDQYDKVHLVPYGEYIPARTWMPWLGKLTIGEIDFSPGKVFKVFQIKNIPFSVLICFEDTLPQHVRLFLNEGARFIVNITNDGWFKDSRAAEEHFHLSRLAAVANGTYVVRSTNTGISGFITPFGDIIGTVQDVEGESLNVQGVAMARFEVQSINTFYRRFGDVFSWCAGALAFLLFILSVFSRKEQNLNREK